MSYDPSNPYATPDNQDFSRHSGNREAALSRTSVCAIFMMIVGALSMLNHLAGGAMAIAGQNLNPFMQQQAPNPEMANAMMIGQIIGSFLFAGLDLLAVLGGWNLKTLGSKSMATAGAVLCCIPICGPCLILGLPFGIWALVLINNAEIKPHFNS